MLIRMIACSSPRIIKLMAGKHVPSLEKCDLSEIGLFAAIRVAHPSVAAANTQALLELGADPKVSRGDWPLLHVVPNSRELVPLLVKYGADIRALDGDGTPLLHAYLQHYGWEKDVAQLRLLIELGADVEARDAKGRTLIEFVRTRSDGFRAMLRTMLVEVGILDPNTQL